uniref:Annexin n=1 Tax=Branchiostoma floridae TaxID=7739 RepID=C3ZI54_BRAFL|eukprot:XP_002591785.1 hypothetical protein BRAFLDRAFT_123531 [Branchiostoma floridae]
MSTKKEDTKFWQQLHNDAIEEPAKEEAAPQKKYFGTVFPAKDFDRVADAKALRHLVTQRDVDEQKLIDILAHRSQKQRMEIALQYETDFDEADREDKNVDYTVTLAEASTLIDLSGHHIMEMISRQTGGFLNPTKDDIKEGYLAIVKCVLSLPGYFAERLYMAMMGFGTDEDTLTRVIVSRCEVDMKKVADIYERRHGKTLGAAIADETSGGYRDMLLALIGQD